MSLPKYENIEKSKILYILTHPTVNRPGYQPESTSILRVCNFKVIVAQSKDLTVVFFAKI